MLGGRGEGLEAKAWWGLVVLPRHSPYPILSRFGRKSLGNLENGLFKPFFGENLVSNSLFK